MLENLKARLQSCDISIGSGELLKMSEEKNDAFRFGLEGCLRKTNMRHV